MYPTYSVHHGLYLMKSSQPYLHYNYEQFIDEKVKIHQDQVIWSNK